MSDVTNIQVRVAGGCESAARVSVRDADGVLLIDPPIVVGPGQATIGGVSPGMSVTLEWAPLADVTHIEPAESADEKPRIELV